MIISINDTWRISSDDHCWITQQQSGTRKDRITGERVPKWKNISYLNTLAGALENLFQEQVRRIEGDDVKMIVQRIEEIRAEIHKAWKRFDDAGLEK